MTATIELPLLTARRTPNDDEFCAHCGCQMFLSANEFKVGSVLLEISVCDSCVEQIEL